MRQRLFSRSLRYRQHLLLDYERLASLCPGAHHGCQHVLKAEPMTDCLSAPDLRRWAVRCLTQANDPRCFAEERERLLKMHAALLALADNADWLQGKFNQNRSMPGHDAPQRLAV